MMLVGLHGVAKVRFDSAETDYMMTKTMMIMVSVSGDCDIGDSLLGDGDGNGDD